MNIEANSEDVDKQAILPDLGKQCSGLIETFDAKRPETVEALASFVKEHPEVYAVATDLRRLVRGMWMATFAGAENLAAYWDGVLRQQYEIEIELAGSSPSGAVRLLARQAAQSWLEVQVLSMHGAASLNDGRRKAMDSANSRLLKTLRTLATVRRLEKGLEIHVTHENVTHENAVPASQQPQASTTTVEEREIQAVETECCRQPRVADRLRGLIPEGVA